MRLRALCAVVAAVATFAWTAAAPPASVANPLSKVCTVTGLVSGLAGRLCSLASHAGRAISAGKQLATGHVGSAVKTALGSASTATSAATTAVGLAALVTWATGSEGYALRATSTLIHSSVRPQLGAAWFTRVYWQMAGIALLLTLPFLFAAAVQAVLASDLALLLRAAFGYLPLAMLGVGVAAQLTTLLLAATDGLCQFLSGAAGDVGSGFLLRAGRTAGVLSLSASSPFLAFVVAVFTIAGAVLLWTELVLRDAVVYVIVAMLPLAFSALVWPARRVWAVRTVELLVGLVLSKLAIVAVLTLGGAALESEPSVAAWLAGFVLLLLGVLAPWAMVRLLPIAELASGAVGRLRGELTSGAAVPGQLALDAGVGAHNWAQSAVAQMRSDADAAGGPGRSGADAELAGLAAGTRREGRASADIGADAGAEPGEIGVEPAGAEPGGANPGGAEPGRAGVDPLGGAESTADAPDTPSSAGAEAPAAPDAAAAAETGAPAFTPAALDLTSAEPDRGPAEPSPAERVPGLPRMFQAPDFGWERQPINDLDPDRQFLDGDGQPTAPGQSPPRHAGVAPEPSDELDASRPEPQRPEGGRL